jgi:uncharacterized membrane protein
MTILQGLQIVAHGLHVVAFVILVGGWFRAYVAMRSASREYDELSSLQLQRRLMKTFFPWVWISFLVLLVTGYVNLFTAFSGFAAAPLYVNLMQAIGWVMIGRIQVPKETPEPFPACSALAALSSRASKTSSGVA